MLPSTHPTVMRIFLILCMLCCCSGYERLSKDSYPLKYFLKLEPSMNGDFTYKGIMSIMMVMKNTSSFSLDSESLSIRNTSLYYGVIPVPHNITQNGNRINVTAIQNLDSENIKFTVFFSGSIRRDLSGFYLSRYTHNGTKRYLASTQFESSSARKAFPCFDEPSFRAEFNLEFTLDPRWGAISNTPIKSDIISGDRRIISFSEQPNIPTYLVAWVIYEDVGFGGRSMSMPNQCGGKSVNFTIMSDRDYEEEYDIALTVAPLLVEALENFTDIRCTAVRDKVHLVAIPDFDAGAMENWGLITFRETALLYDKDYSTAQDKEQIIMVVAHELAHQWFGNLVTPEWWSYTWLSEGFARYLQYFISDKFLPELRLAEQFVVDRRQLALDVDSVDAHPLTNENLTSQLDIDDMFDVITYDKGASVIHMMSSLLGPNFSAGINQYLTTVNGSGGVTKPDLFFSSFPKEAQLIRPWTETSGYPIIIASENNSTLSLTQIKVTGWNETITSNWTVPISISVNGELSWHYLEPNKTLNIPIQDNSTYLINFNQTGYYRVWYKEQSRWQPRNVSSITRSQLIDDVMALAYAGLLSYDVAMNVTSYHLRNDLDYLTWKTGLRTLSRLRDLLHDSQIQSNFTGQILSLMAGIIDNIAFNESISSIPEKLNQMNVLKHACKFGHQGCLNSSDQLALNLSNTTAEKRSALLCTVVSRGNTTVWESMVIQYKTAKSPAESQLMLSSLTCSTDRLLLRRLLDLVFTDAVRRHDVTSVISFICSTRIGAEETFSYFKNNSMKIYNYLGELKSINKILKSATNYATSSQLMELRQLTQNLPGLQIDPFIANAEKTLSWKNKVVQQLTAYITREPVPTQPPTSGTSTASDQPSSNPTSSSHPNSGVFQNEFPELVLLLLLIVLFYSK